MTIRKKIKIMKRRKILIPIILPREKSGTYWDNINGGNEKCYVCGREFKEKEKENRIFIGYHRFTGEKLIRHRKCLAGSVQWKKKFSGCFNDALKSINLIDEKL